MNHLQQLVSALSFMGADFKTADGAKLPPRVLGLRTDDAARIATVIQFASAGICFDQQGLYIGHIAASPAAIVSGAAYEWFGRR